MASALRESRDDQNEVSTGDTHAELIGELSKSVSRLKSLSVAEYGDASSVSLEHTLDAILNMAQKTTFDESTTIDSVRVAKPVQKRNSGVRENRGRFACGLRLLMCHKDEFREEDYTAVLPDLTSLQTKVDKKTKGSFWRDERFKAAEKGGNRYCTHPQEAQKAYSGASCGYSTHSKEDLVVKIGRRHEDDISSLSLDLFTPRPSYTYDTNPVFVAAAASGGNQCVGQYRDMLSCRAQHRHLPVDEAQISFFDLLTCHRSHVGRQERWRDQQSSILEDDDQDMKILGVRQKADESLTSISSGSLSSGRKFPKDLSRLEAEHMPRFDPNQMQSVKAAMFISHQPRKAKT